jgi:formyltetrahydrofolate-dependent phosphoribosylglycinamide formyltransferase
MSHLAHHGDVQVAVVISNSASAGVLARASARGIPTHVLQDAANADEWHDQLARHAVTAVALAGYLKFVPAGVTRRFVGRMVNVHPSLLPAFGGHGMYGHRVHAAVLAAGARVTGATVHFVDEVYDRGPIVAQWPVPVSVDDTPDTLAARVLRAEHRLFPPVVRAVALQHVTLEPDGHVHGLAPLLPDAAFLRGADLPPALPFP